MVFADMAAMQRIRDRIVEDKAASMAQGLSTITSRPGEASGGAWVATVDQNVEKPVPGSEEKVDFSHVAGCELVTP